MLKKNLVKTVFSSHGLLLIFPAVTAMKGSPSYSVQEKRLYHRSIKDTLDLPLPDSTKFYLSEADFADAPQIALNKNASKFVTGFLKREEEALEKAKKRSTSYFKMIDGVLERYGLPVELKYLAVIESDLKTTAVSKVGAKGLWQLMPVTARDLGLKVTKKYDERVYAYKSTVAAAKYLKDLYAQFGDWLLVIAAYNSGPRPIYQAIKKSGSKNFWALQRYLPEESRGHVKRFIGAHYYFEGKGSLVTLTKAETIKYQKQLEAFKATIQTSQIKRDSVTVALNTK